MTLRNLIDFLMFLEPKGVVPFVIEDGEIASVEYIKELFHEWVEADREAE
jgi:hypothetical protein